MDGYYSADPGQFIEIHRKEYSLDTLFLKFLIL